MAEMDAWHLSRDSRANTCFKRCEVNICEFVTLLLGEHGLEVLKIGVLTVNRVSSATERNQNRTRFGSTGHARTPQTNPVIFVRDFRVLVGGGHT